MGRPTTVVVSSPLPQAGRRHQRTTSLYPLTHTHRTMEEHEISGFAEVTGRSWNNLSSQPPTLFSTQHFADAPSPVWITWHLTPPVSARLRVDQGAATASLPSLMQWAHTSVWVTHVRTQGPWPSKDVLIQQHDAQGDGHCDNALGTTADTRRLQDTGRYR